MSDQIKKEIESYWSRADESLIAASELLKKGHFDFAASRAYYAAFYAASAILMKSGSEFTKHSAVIAAVHKQLVREGLLPVEMGKNLNRLFELRGIGDYGMAVHVPSEDAEKAVADATEIVAALRKVYSTNH